MDLTTIAAKIAQVYEANKKVEAVLLGGSVSRKWHDEFSDIELFIFWKQPPTDVDRMGSIETVNGEVIDFHPFEEEEWSESYITEGIKLEISNFLTATVKQLIHDVVSEYDTDLNKQCIVATISEGVVLTGEESMTALKAKTSPYPDELREAMVKGYLDFGNRWNNRKALLQREDWLMLYKVMVAAQENLMAILFGLNKHYVHHPAFKWQSHSLRSMTVVPINAEERMRAVFLKHPVQGLKELESLMDEVFQLVEEQFPEHDFSAFIRQSTFLRPRS